MPSAAAENALHRPSADSPLRCREKLTSSPGVAITVTPPARASEHSPVRRAWQARCSVTSAEEHAVSTVTAGPSRPSTYDTRPDSTLVALPVTRWPSSPPVPCSTACRPALYPPYAAPTNTPVADPRSVPGSTPVRSSASQLASSSSRCCGSMASASRGLIEKNPGSKSPASWTNPPPRTYEVPSWSGSASYRRSRSHSRFWGNPEIASPPLASSSHSSSGLRTPPGNRQLIATIATGSPSTGAAVAVTISVPAASPSSSPRRNPASTAGVG